jgi:hypothetical protein
MWEKTGEQFLPLKFDQPENYFFKIHSFRFYSSELFYIFEGYLLLFRVTKFDA